VAGTVGTPFGFTITATGSPLSYAASPLPAGLVRNTTTGAITGTPTAVGTTPVLLGATNTFGTGNATLTIVVAAAGTTPVIANNPVVAAGTVGVPFSFAISATGLPTSYAANVLPAGLTLNTVTGVITGTPAADGVTAVLLSATNAFGTGRTSDLTITIAPAGSAPSITNRPLTAAGTVGAPFAFTIVASGSPTSYTATPLPAGLSLVAATGAITGRPAVAGTTVVLLGATNSTGTGTAALTITVGAAGVVPVITSPSTAPGTVGSPITTYLIEATGLPTSYSATGLPPGLTLDPLTGAISGTPTTAGTYLVTITATNSAGSSSTTVTMIIAGAAVAPVFTGPATATGAAGTPFVTYFIAATGLPTSYTATGLPPGLSLNALTGAINGTPTSPGTYGVTITATNAYGTSTTTLVISLTPNLSSRITNFAARAISGPGDQTLIMGFVVSGDNKNILVRGIGPTLSAFGITNPLADPLLTLFDNTGAVATNDDWSTTSTGQSQSATIGATAARVGAFALPADSKDSSLLFTVNNGAHTTGLLRPNSTTGVALTEIYDLDTVLGSRLVNVSARMNVTGGEGTLIAGFSIAGTVPKQVLIRGVGPALAQFGVSGVLADPMIAVYSGSTQIYSNDNWEAGTSTAAQISAAAAQVGAFALPAGSKDAVLLVTLQPGNYTVLVSGGTATGVALIEIYDTQ
jgi:PKD repeat protein